MAIRLQLLTADLKEIELIERYWAMDEAGQFLEKVSALGECLALPQGVTLIGFIRQRCRAFDENQVCPECGALIEIRNRSEAKKVPLRSTGLCARCKADRDAIALEAERVKDAELQRLLAEFGDRQASKRVDYATVPDAQVLLLLALDTAVTPRLTSGGFTIGDCRGLAPWYVGDFVEQLQEAGLILEDPLKARPGTYYWKGEEIWSKGAQLVYLLASGTTAGDGKEAISTLSGRVLTDAQGLFGLWLDYSVADVICYLGDQCDRYSLELTEQQWDELKSIMRSALESYSVGQLWFVAWAAAKDASSMTNLRYYNREKAAATIPGKIRRRLEKVRRGALELSSWSRPEHQPAGTLGMVLTETFGTDETTTGLTANACIARLTGQECASRTTDVLCAPIRELMSNALALDLGTAVMLRFADLIRAGHDVSFAVEEIGSTLRA